MTIRGKFSKVAETETSIIVGMIGGLNANTATHDNIIYIAQFYNINTDADKFGYHYITADGAIKKGCKLPVNNYNDFIEIFK